MKLSEFLLGVLTGLFIIILLLLYNGHYLPYPIVVDCGCGAQIGMAQQCFESGNLSSWQCEVFK